MCHCNFSKCSIVLVSCNRISALPMGIRKGKGPSKLPNRYDLNSYTFISYDGKNDTSLLSFVLVLPRHHCIGLI